MDNRVALVGVAVVQRVLIVPLPLQFINTLINVNITSVCQVRPPPPTPTVTRDALCPSVSHEPSPLTPLPSLPFLTAAPDD